MQFYYVYVVNYDIFIYICFLLGIITTVNFLLLLIEKKRNSLSHANLISSVSHYLLTQSCLIVVDNIHRVLLHFLQREP